MISSWASDWPQIRILAERNPREISIANDPNVLLPTSVLGCFYSTSADDTTLMAESKEELKSLLMKVKEDSEKADLKLIKKAFIKLRSWHPVPSLHGK